MDYVWAVLTVLAAYVIGSIPWGFIIGKFNGVDIRTVGSRNIGATNVTRCVGKAAGKLCFALDFIKGVIPVLAAQWFFRDWRYLEYVVILALFAVVLGHMFPVFLKFKGGKGVSTAAGAIIALTPLPLLIALVVWVVVFLVSRYVSLASISAAVVLPVVAWVFYITRTGGHKLAHSPIVLVFLTLVAVLAIIRHRSNIQRLLDGTENRFGKKVPEKPSDEASSDDKLSSDDSAK